jgi:hypothetical protein
MGTAGTGASGLEKRAGHAYVSTAFGHGIDSSLSGDGAGQGI